MSRTIALIADIHANDTALEATLQEIASRGISRGLVVGDVIMRGEQPQESVDRLIGLGWPCVVGNTDRKVLRSIGTDATPKQLAKVGSRWWTRERLDPEAIAWLEALPKIVRCEFDGHRIAVIHGSPGDSRIDLGPDAPEHELLDFARELEADCVVSAHTHAAGAHEVGDVLFVNPGSVGETGDLRDRRPRWAWLESASGRLVAHLETLDQPLARPRIKKSHV